MRRLTRHRGATWSGPGQTEKALGQESPTRSNRSIVAMSLSGLLSALWKSDGVRPPPFDPASIEPVAGPVLSALRDGVQDGTIVLPSDPEYAALRLPWNYDVAGTPSVIVRCKSEADVVAVVSCAGQHDVGLCVAGGRHSFYSSVSGAIMLDLGLLNAVTVDAEQSIAVVQGGAKLENLDAACAPYGLAVTAGTNPDTGVGGLTLGGGVGLLARRFGMTIDNLVAVKMVLADGQVVGADENMNPDLFWAVRGGGGNFGVVLEFRFRLHKIGNQGRVVAGNMVYLRPWILRPVMEYPPTAMRLHRDYWLEMPPEMGALAVVVSQGPFVAMYCYSGDVDEGKRIAGDKLSTLGRTFINTAGNEVSYHLEAQRLALGPDGKGQQPGYHYEKSVLVDSLPDDLLDILWEQSSVGPSGSALVIMILGGKVASVASEATAFPHRQARFWILALAWFPYSEDVPARTAAVEWTRQTVHRIRPFSSGTYQTIGKRDEDEPSGAAQASARVEAWRRHGDGTDVFGGNIERLRRIKAKYDPKNVFKYNNNIDPKA